MVKASRRTVPTQRWATALAFGAWIGVPMTSAPTARQMSSKAWVNLRSRSRIRNRTAVASSWWRGGCGLAGRPTRRWVGGDASQLDAPGLQLNEEQHVQPQLVTRAAHSGRLIRSGSCQGAGIDLAHRVLA